jgi:hypothetical protein
VEVARNPQVLVVVRDSKESDERSCGLAGGLAGVRQERLTTWLVSVAVSLRENAVWQALVNAGRVLGHLGFDLILQVNSGHFG